MTKGFRWGVAMIATLGVAMAHAQTTQVPPSVASMHIDLTLSDPSLPNVVGNSLTFDEYVRGMAKASGNPPSIIANGNRYTVTFTSPQMTIVEVLAPENAQTLRIQKMVVNNNPVAEDAIYDTAFTLLMAAASGSAPPPGPRAVNHPAPNAKPVDKQALMSAVKMSRDDNGFYAVMPDFGSGHMCDDVIHAEPYYFEPGVEQALLSKLDHVALPARCEIAADIVFGVDKEWAKNTDPEDVDASRERAHELLDQIYSAQ